MKDPSTPLFDIVLKALAQTVGREKNDRRIRKQEMKPAVFPDDVIVYAEDPRGATKRAAGTN